MSYIDIHCIPLYSIDTLYTKRFLNIPVCYRFCSLIVPFLVNKLHRIFFPIVVGDRMVIGKGCRHFQKR